MSTPVPASNELLFAAFPGWRRFARTETAEDGGAYTVIEVPAPVAAKVEHGLFIDTSNQEVTVGFDFYHSHFDDWVGDVDCVGTQAALEFIKQVISERVAVVSWWNDDTWCGSVQIEAGTTPEVPSWAAPGSYNRIRIRSWKGSYNVDRDA
jgi:hypothetical protein